MSRRCDRCGLSEGGTRSGKMQPTILEHRTILGRQYLLCDQCRRTLALYKPLAPKP